jgi:hypothetical protein
MSAQTAPVLPWRDSRRCRHSLHDEEHVDGTDDDNPQDDNDWRNYRYRVYGGEIFPAQHDLGRLALSACEAKPFRPAFEAAPRGHQQGLVLLIALSHAGRHDHGGPDHDARDRHRSLGSPAIWPSSKTATSVADDGVENGESVVDRSPAHNSEILKSDDPRRRLLLEHGAPTSRP